MPTIMFLNILNGTFSFYNQTKNRPTSRRKKLQVFFWWFSDSDSLRLLNQRHLFEVHMAVL